jgi:hypothetical protein
MGGCVDEERDRETEREGERERRGRGREKVRGWRSSSKALYTQHPTHYPPHTIHKPGRGQRGHDGRQAGWWPSSPWQFLLAVLAVRALLCFVALLLPHPHPVAQTGGRVDERP